ncbi:hypothetical protein COCNU_scaffold062490G000010 [Cocos nucifera]|nr:hypothetical protein [Cocos nucifera]
MDGVELERDVKVLSICEETYGGDIKEFLPIMDNGEAEVGQPLWASAKALKEGGLLDGIGGSTVDVDDVDHMLSLHCLEDGLIGNEEGEVDEGAEVEEVAVGEEGLGHRWGWYHRWRVEGGVEAQPKVEDVAGEVLYEVGYDVLYGVAIGSSKK